MKLIIQIPCFNEADSLPQTIATLPRRLPGIDAIELLVIDDGSSDGTSEVAERLGVHHIERHRTNRGLAAAFRTGLERALAEGADIIVNTDADNQYRASDIPLLIAPILRKEADFVVGARPIAEIEHFSPLKKALQRMGSASVRWVSGTDVADAPSGFRALSRKAAMQVNVFSQYTYTLETLIQAGTRNIPVVNVPIQTNPDLRPSRLVKSVRSYVSRSVFTMGQVFAIYRPFQLFGTLAAVLIGAGLLLGLRYVYFVAIGEGEGHIQSVILTAVLLLTGFLTLSLAVIASLVSVNRRLLEDVQVPLREMRFGRNESST